MILFENGKKSGLAALVKQTIVQPVIVDNLPDLYVADEERVNELIGSHHHARLFTELQEFSFGFAISPSCPDSLESRG